jgi:hypothetical protein
MLPLTLLTAQKTASLLTSANALQQQLAVLASACNTIVPPITPGQVVLSSATPDLGDKDIQLTYPRICLYSAGLRNTQVEKFRSLSGSVLVIADVWASGNLVNEVDQWIHFYVEAMTSLLRSNIGDWGDGLFFSGVYDVQFQPPKAGGLGYVQSAKVTFTFNVSQN